ncbi:hypothetical protein VTN77DRAFT_9083 [Rasamsonia byssochlamydoides]|uniref:uncharacterized protein n=1 Tax=Rasamsonia byssochlamydoides TaxID=89139 RepID=UPI003742C2DF
MTAFKTVTMLGRLLSTFSPATYSSRNQAVLESVTEEEHTSGLLFPDASLLRRSNTHAYPLQSSFNSPNASSAGAYDDRGGLELDVIKDFRFIIAQNALGDRDEPCILLDSRGSPDPLPQGLGLDPQLFDSASGRHSRTSSVSRASRRGSIQSLQSSLTEASSISQAATPRKASPVTSGAFTRARGRSSTFSQTDGGYEPLHNRPSADSTESGLLNCIFGSSAFSYRGSSTKMHILSTDSESGNAPGTSPAPREMDTLAARGTSMRGPLARAYSSGAQPSSSSYFSDRAHEVKSPSKVTVLITRMFSVNLPEGPDTTVESPEVPNPAQLESSQEGGYPFPDFLKRRKIKEKKTPMYAVAITIQIPLAARHHGRPQSRLGGHGPDGVRPMSFSLDSDHRWSSSFLDDNLSPSANLDERLDILVDHWDVITRTLSHLERLARREILILLKKIDALSGPQPKPAKAPNMQRTNQTIVQLRPNVLAGHTKLRQEMLLSAQRISAALRIPRVVIGQSRWGVWREEARWIARLLADKEHGLFFLVLITAFLGNHTEWLNSLGPEWYRKRHYQLQKAQQDADPTILNRTVIISDNKMVARRLIFLLSAFLPSKQRFEVLGSPLRPSTSTSTSMRPLSQSPPNVPILRQESLRRTINRRARAQRLNAEDTENHQRSTSVSSGETAHRSSEDADPGNPPAEYPKSRRDSDVRSIRTASLPIHANDVRTRNCSAATTSATTPGSAIPVPHFASRQRRTHGNDSYASAKLLQNLRRSESSSTSSDGNFPGSKWGNILSGLWSSRQELSGNDGHVASARRGSTSRTLAARPEDRPQDLITSKTAETESSLESGAKEPPSSENITIPSSPTAARHGLDQDQQEPLSQADHVKESPLKLSVRSKDGVVDVDLPFPGFVSLSSSGDSTLASPKKTRTSVTSVDAGGSTHSSVSNFNFPLRDYDGPNLNVAGWLKSFHEDFLLQAVRPYHGVEADIKRAMLAEPTPHVSVPTVDAENANANDRWVDVATTLIADTRTCTVKRLRLRRKISANGVARQGQSASFGGTPSTTPRQGSETLSSTGQFSGFFSNTVRYRKNSTPAALGLGDWLEVNDAEVKFIEEPVMDVDGTLVDAVERVLVQSGQSSLAQSRTPSPHRGHRGEDKSTGETAGRNDTPPVVEVPRGECRKMVLGALEEVVRSVAAEHCREDVEAEFGIDAPLSESDSKRRTVHVDNTLREGVRKWLLDVEEAC